jgi:hypothetical protein
MKKICASLFVLGASVWAADFWQVKPFTDWSDKDLQKMLTNSPWAKSIGVNVSGPSAITAGAPAGAGRGAGGVGQEGTPISEQSGRGGRGPLSPPNAPPDVVVADVVLRWQSALPIKQALARLKYGAEAGSSAEAKETLGRQESNFVIVASGEPLRAMLRGDPEAVKAAVLGKTMLLRKGKNPIQPSDIQVNAAARNFEIYFTFPRTPEVTAEDKELEFVTKIGDLSLRSKFQLRSMMLNGKLEL